METDTTDIGYFFWLGEEGLEECTEESFERRIEDTRRAWANWRQLAAGGVRLSDAATVVEETDDGGFIIDGFEDVPGG